MIDIDARSLISWHGAFGVFAVSHLISATLVAGANGGGQTPALRTSQAPPASEYCFYGGDFDFRAAVASSRNTLIEEAWIFDDLEWPGGMVGVVWANFLVREMTPVAGDVAVFQGMREGEWGAEIVQVWDITDFTWQRTGRSAFNRDEFELRLNVAFELPPGHYHIGVRPVGTGAGENWMTSTSGANALGTPIGNGNSFFQSTFFGFPLPTDVQNLIGQGTIDFSLGLCGEAGPGITLSLEGDCPGAMTARLSGATPGGRVALIRSAPGRCGGQTTIPPPNPCSGTILPLGGAALVRIVTADGEGNAALTGNVPNSACGRVCLIAVDLTSCEVSNVAEF